MHNQFKSKFFLITSDSVLKYVDAWVTTCAIFLEPAKVLTGLIFDDQQNILCLIFWISKFSTWYIVTTKKKNQNITLGENKGLLCVFFVKRLVFSKYYSVWKQRLKTKKGPHKKNIGELGRSKECKRDVWVIKTSLPGWDQWVIMMVHGQGNDFQCT